MRFSKNEKFDRRKENLFLEHVLNYLLLAAVLFKVAGWLMIICEVFKNFAKTLQKLCKVFAKFFRSI